MDRVCHIHNGYVSCWPPFPQNLIQPPSDGNWTSITCGIGYCCVLREYGNFIDGTWDGEPQSHCFGERKLELRNSMYQMVWDPLNLDPNQWCGLTLPERDWICYRMWSHPFTPLAPSDRPRTR